MSELRTLAGRRTGRFVGRVYDFIDDLRDIGRAASSGNTAVTLNAIREAGLEQAMRQLDAKRPDASHGDDVDALVTLAALHPDVASFEGWLREVLTRPSGGDGVTLATVHSVKGQEWDRVLVLDVREGILPHRLAQDVEEERRILHVAITRGRQEVAVLTDRARPSRFIEELHTQWSGPQHAPPGGRRRGASHQAAADRTIAAREGLTLEANGGYRGTIVAIDDAGVHIATPTGGRLKIRYGERVKIDDEVLVLGAPL